MLRRLRPQDERLRLANLLNGQHIFSRFVSLLEADVAVARARRCARLEARGRDRQTR